jgi:hypothetical protein
MVCSVASPAWSASAPVRSWTVVPSPSPGGERNTLYAVAALAIDDAWTVGAATTDGVSQTLILHWDGTAWSRVPSPSPLNAANILRGVVALASDDVWAVGTALNSFTPGSRQFALIEHWDGTRWSIVPSPNPGGEINELSGVGRIGSSNGLWAVGSYQNAGPGAPTRPLIERWDGTSWNMVSDPGLPDGFLVNVSRRGSPSDHWAVGGGFDQFGRYQTLTEHWNGTSWERVPSPSLGTCFLNAVTQVPRSRQAWAVGNINAPTRPLIEHWNGSTWSLVASPVPPDSTGHGLQGVAAQAERSVWAVGFLYTSVGEFTLIEHWNGSSWRIVDSPNVGSSNLLNAVAPVPGTAQLWAVGEYFNSPSAGLSLIERYS